MFSSLFLIYHIVRWVVAAIMWFVLAFVKWFVMLLIWLISPDQALECYHEMEAQHGQE